MAQASASSASLCPSPEPAVLSLLPVAGLPEVRAGDDLCALLADRLDILAEGDVLIVTQKIVSKAEGRLVRLTGIEPSAAAARLAVEVNKPPALVELVLRESTAVIRKAPNVLITRHRLGHVMANAGIDASNVGAVDGATVLLLPADPDASAAALRRGLTDRFGFDVPVVISDSFGRPWRMGTTDVAIGVAGLAALIDRRGETDRDGRVLQMTLVAAADAIAAAAGLVMGEGSEGIPVVILRGWTRPGAAQTSVALLRPAAEDLFQ